MGLPIVDRRRSLRKIEYGRDLRLAKVERAKRKESPSRWSARFITCDTFFIHRFVPFFPRCALSLQSDFLTTTSHCSIRKYVNEIVSETSREREAEWWWPSSSFYIKQYHGDQQCRWRLRQHVHKEKKSRHLFSFGSVAQEEPLSIHSDRQPIAYSRKDIGLCEVESRCINILIENEEKEKLN